MCCNALHLLGLQTTKLFLLTTKKNFQLSIFSLLGLDWYNLHRILPGSRGNCTTFQMLPSRDINIHSSLIQTTVNLIGDFHPPMRLLAPREKQDGKYSFFSHQDFHNLYKLLLHKTEVCWCSPLLEAPKHRMSNVLMLRRDGNIPSDLSNP